jgi:hypothetical protein
MNGRYANKDTTIPTGGGPDGRSPVFVPKGTSVNYSVHMMHRRKDIWGEDADEFRPERWEGRKPGWEYLPVGLIGLLLFHDCSFTPGGVHVVLLTSNGKNSSTAARGSASGSSLR